MSEKHKVKVTAIGSNLDILSNMGTMTYRAECDDPDSPFTMVMNVKGPDDTFMELTKMHDVDITIQIEGTLGVGS